MGRRRAIAAGVWLCCALYAGGFVTRGWIAHDEGTIGQSAERVLAGDVPHRDYDEVYTGGLTYVHAAAMQVAGVSLRTPRYVLFAAFLVFLAIVHAIARRVAPAAALLAMPLATVWSVPNYFAALPSWYLLFFAAGAVLAGLRFLDSGHRGWLAAAGICAGLAVLAKITGVFVLAAGMMFLVFAAHGTAHPPGPARSSAASSVAGVTMALLTGAVLIVPVFAASSAVRVLPIVLPGLAICGFVGWHAWVTRGRPAGQGRDLARLAWPYLAGAAAPVAAFAVVFLAQGALDDLLRGVFVLPLRRLDEAAIDPPPLAAALIAAPYLALLLAKPPGDRRRDWALAGVLAAVLAVVLTAGGQPVVYRAVWAFVRATPLAIAAGGIWLLARRRMDQPPAGRAGLVLLLSSAAFGSLVQYPYASPIYFCYAAPLVALAGLAVVSSRRPIRVAHGVIGAYVLLFAVLFVNRSYGWNLGVAFVPQDAGSRLELPRAGLRVPAEDAAVYTALVRLIQPRAAGGALYAGPDCPEVYFLAGLPNPTRTIFDFLSPEPLDPAAMSDLLARAPVRVAVINTAPLFSPALEAGVVALLRQRFPLSQQIGRFEVRFVE